MSDLRDPSLPVERRERPPHGSAQGDGTSSAAEERELRAVAALLRGLPDPEPARDLTALVMERIETRAASPRRLRSAFRRVASPRAAMALAAGLSCLVVLTIVRDGGVGSSERAEAPTPRRVATAPDALAAGSVPAFFRGAPAPALGDDLATVLSSEENRFDRQLDRQINYALLDPDAFFARLERLPSRERLMGRLAERAARRGDSAQLALRLRAHDHVLAKTLSERFLRASLVEYVTRR